MATPSGRKRPAQIPRPYPGLGRLDRTLVRATKPGQGSFRAPATGAGFGRAPGTAIPRELSGNPGPKLRVEATPSFARGDQECVVRRRLHELACAWERSRLGKEPLDLARGKPPGLGRDELDTERRALLEKRPLRPTAKEPLACKRVRDRLLCGRPSEQVEIPPLRRKRAEHEHGLRRGRVDRCDEGRDCVRQ